MTIFDTIYFALLISTLGLYIALIRSYESYVRFVVAVLACWLLLSITAIYLSAYAGVKNNLFIFHIAAPIEFSILMTMFHNYIVNKKVRRLINITIMSFILLSILFALFIQPPVVNNTYISTLEAMLLISTALYFLRETLLLQQVQALHRYPMFWISVGILFHYVGNLLIEGMLNYLIAHSMDLARKVYHLSYFIKYILFVLLMIAALCVKNFTEVPKKQPVI